MPKLFQKSSAKPTFVEDSSDTASLPQLKVKWKSKKSDPENGGYNKEVLTKIFLKHGEITELVVSATKKGLAIVEFKSSQDAQKACDSESGLSSNPLKVTWMSGQPQGTRNTVKDSKSCNAQAEQMSSQAANGNLFNYTSQGNPTQTYDSSLVSGFSFNPSTAGTDDVSNSKDRDFESLVLMRLRQAEERKRLAEQMAKEDYE